MGLTPAGNPAFLPRDLPPDLDYTPALVARLSDADRALGRLAGMARSLRNPALLVTPFLRREAVLSSRIEGIQTTFAELAAFEATPEAPVADTDVTEVTNYLRALDYALDPDTKLPVSLRLIRELHRILMCGVRGGTFTAGEFRTVQNHLGEPGSTEATAIFVPPPVPAMNKALDRLERFLHAKVTLPPLVRIALVHYQFEAIHPFTDGNGRIGRLLITVLLCEQRLLDQPLLYLSAYFERHRTEYYARLLAVSQEGDYEGWIEFFLKGVEQQSLDAVHRAGRLQAVREEFHSRLRVARASSLTYRLADLLIEKPAVSANTVVRRLGVTHRAASMALARVKQLGLVTEPLGRLRNRIYLANEVQQVLEEELS